MIPLVKEGAKTLHELAELSVYAVKVRPLKLDEKTLGHLNEETRARLARLVDVLSAANDWSPQGLQDTLKTFAESEGVGLGKIGPALRGVLSGGAPAPDLGSALAALGREESIKRVQDALSQVR